jgi:hypothetical protein
MADSAPLSPNRIVEVPAPRGTVRIGQELPVAFIAGPCQLESLTHAQMIAGHMAEVCAAAGAQYVFKASYDKANRTSLKGRRGLGMDAGLKVLEAVRAMGMLPDLARRWNNVHARTMAAQRRQTYSVGALVIVARTFRTILQSAVLPKFRDGDMPGGVVAGTDALIAQLSLPDDLAKAAVQKAASKPASDGFPFELAPVLFFLFIVLLVALSGRRRRSGILGWLPWILASSGGWSSGSGGGGWSGGGGGFSGGGGSFGGGGSSGSW